MCLRPVCLRRHGSSFISALTAISLSNGNPTRMRYPLHSIVPPRIIVPNVLVWNRKRTPHISTFLLLLLFPPTTLLRHVRASPHLFERPFLRCPSHFPHRSRSHSLRLPPPPSPPPTFIPGRPHILQSLPSARVPHTSLPFPLPLPHSPPLMDWLVGKQAEKEVASIGQSFSVSYDTSV